MTRIAVSALPRDPGPAGWNALLGPPETADELAERRQAEWLVIGAGFAGLAAARRLRQNRPADERIVVLDAVRIGEGPAGRNSGFMIDLPHDLASEDYGGAPERDRLQIRANRMAIDFALAAAQDASMPPEAVMPVGKVNAAASQRGLAHNRSYAAHLSSLGESGTLLDAAAMHDLTGSRYWLGGLFTPGTVMLQPALYVRELALGLRRDGVAIHENSPVRTLDRDGNDWRVETTAGAVVTPRVVLAVNGHLQSFGFFRGRLIHVFTYASMSRELDAAAVRKLGGAPTWGITPADPMGTTVRRIAGRGGHRLIVRNRFTCDPAMTVPDTRIAHIARDHDRALAARFPDLAGLAMEYRWGGRLCLSRNDAPAFGEVEPGLFAAGCQNGLGAARGTFAGIAAADLAAGIDSEAVRIMQAAPSPGRVPPAPLTRLGANGLFRFSERRAGREF